MGEIDPAEIQGTARQNAAHADQAFTQVYEELRRIARSHLYGQPAGHTLQTTALVHEAFLKLRGSKVSEDRGQFLRLAAEAMRQILIDHARGKKRGKRGGGNARREDLADVAVLAVNSDGDTILALESAICRLEVVSARAAEIIKLRFFTGLSMEDTASITGLSVRTVNRHWRFARAWLYDALGGDPDKPGNDGNKSAASIQRSDEKSRNTGKSPN